jgi:hypothetical protein
MADVLVDQEVLSSPFALMLPEAARCIAERASKLNLPTRKCSPLSNPRLGGAPLEAEADDSTGEYPL